MSREPRLPIKTMFNTCKYVTPELEDFCAHGFNTPDVTGSILVVGGSGQGKNVFTAPLVVTRIVQNLSRNVTTKLYCWVQSASVIDNLKNLLNHLIFSRFEGEDLKKIDALIDVVAVPSIESFISTYSKLDNSNPSDRYDKEYIFFIDDKTHELVSNKKHWPFFKNVASNKRKLGAVLIINTQYVVGMDMSFLKQINALFIVGHLKKKLYQELEQRMQEVDMPPYSEQMFTHVSNILLNKSFNIMLISGPYKTSLRLPPDENVFMLFKMKKEIDSVINPNVQKNFEPVKLGSDLINKERAELKRKNVTFNNNNNINYDTDESSDEKSNKNGIKPIFKKKNYDDEERKDNPEESKLPKRARYDENFFI